ncbi:MAG: hypothetical protein ACI8PT_000971 [Gammaproteobacteria bacterium]|jgi:hypothetical protein
MLFDDKGRVLRESTMPALASKVLPSTLLVLPLPRRPFFPQQMTSLVFDEATAHETLERVGNPPRIAGAGARGPA